MLSKISIQAAYPAAMNLAARGLVLTPLEETPLMLLCADVLGQATDLAGTTPVGADAPQSFADALHDASRTESAGVYVHDARIEQSVAMAAQGVNATLNIARTQVAPMIKQCVTEIQQAVDNITNERSHPLNVVPFFYKEIWDDAALLSSVERYQGRAVDIQLRPLGLPQPANWLSVLCTGVSSIDESVQKFVADSDEKFLARAWDSVFGTKGGSLAALANELHQATADVAMFAYLAARNMIENIPAGTQVSLDAWRGYMTELMAAAGGQINYQLERRSQIIAVGTLFIGWPPGDTGTIQVFGDTYNTFLANGGSPEAVMGAHLAGQHNQLRMNTPTAEMAAFADRWSRAQSVIAQRLAYANQDLILRQANLVISKAIVDLGEKRVVSAEVMQERLRQLISRTSLADTQQLWTLVRKLVCQTMFAHTDSERLLAAMDEIATSQDLKVREAAYLATADYIVQWMLSQLKIEKMQGAR